MLRLINAQFQKTKRISVRWLWLLLPIIYAIALVGYFHWHTSSTTMIYGTFFLGLTICTEFTLSIFIPLIYNVEINAANFANELRVGVSRRRLFISRFLLIVFLSLGMELVAVLTFTILEVVTMHLIPSLKWLAVTSSLPIVYLLPVIIFYQILACCWQSTGALISGVFLTLSAILLGTTELGQKVWIFLPWTWAVDLVNQLMLTPQHFSLKLWAELGSLNVLLTIGALALGGVWYNHWEAITTTEADI